VRLVYPCPAACGGDADWGEGRWLLVETLALERRPAGPERSGILAAP
jgi:hypothetical protein